MKRITDFIVRRRNIIMVLFIVFAIISVFVSKNVKINYDMTEYMPADSETSIGLDIMDKEFEPENTSVLNVMFSNLTDDEKLEIQRKLSSIEGVSSIDYEKDNENYNKDGYTLYVLNVDGEDDSITAKSVYDFVYNNFKDYEFYTSGSISTRNTTVLPLWIIILSVSICTIILIIMCESYIEPFLFLGCIGIAILLNNGTNIIFGTISNITGSIAAILQLALSMDYSIMLMERYKQEKENANNKVEAMEEALYKSFSAISSSSVTTIVGLITLVFMSFTIGRDLGFVLAKGVFFSLLVIFTCLPALILMCDKLIVKTKKRVPHFKLDFLGKFAYKFRLVGFVVLIGLFVGSYIIKSNLGILYTASEMNKVGDVFSENNQIAILYKSSDETKIANMLPELENNEKVDEVLGYGNTIGQKLKYNEFNNKLKDLDVDNEIEDYLLKILYYKYYNKDITNRMTFDEFVEFTRESVIPNENFSSQIDDYAKNNVDRLAKFTTIGEMYRKRNYREIANIVEMSEKDCFNLFVYYYADKIDIQLSVKEFVDFINNDVITDKNYSDSISKSARDSLNTVSKFLNKETLNKNMLSKEMANLFGIDEEKIKSLYLYYYITYGTDNELTLNEFASYILNEVMLNPNYSSLFDEGTIENLKMLQTMSNKAIINNEMTIDGISVMFGIEKEAVSQLVLLKNIMSDNGTTHDYTSGKLEIQTITPYEFVEFILKNSENEQIANSMSLESLSKLKNVYGIMNSSNNDIKYSYSEIAEFVGINENITKQLYALYAFENTELQLTPVTLVEFILKNKDDEMLKNSIDSATINNLKLIKKIMDSVLNNYIYPVNGMADLLSLNSEDVKLLYSLYSAKHINGNLQASLNEFVQFILDKVVTNEKYSDKINDDKRVKLNTINGIMNAVINRTEYSPEEIFAIISNLTDTIDQNTVELLYIYYGSEKYFDEAWKITIEELINYVNDEILNDSRFDDFIDDEMRDKISDSKTTIEDNKKKLIGTNYSRVVLNTKFEDEGEETFGFLQGIYDKLNDVDELYLIGNSPMAYEMSKSFESEFNKISIISMIAIFIVVVFTFKSLGIPTALVLVIQCAVYMTMAILVFLGGEIYFIAILIVQSILMGATIDYAILYTSYYRELRQQMDIKEAIINSYNKSINTIITSASILILATFVVGYFSTAIISKICVTLSQGVLCSTLLILLVLPELLAVLDRFVAKKK